MFVVNVPLGLIFDEPTIRGLAKALDKLRKAEDDLGLVIDGDKSGSATPTKTEGADKTCPVTGAAKKEIDYAEDYEVLLKQLDETYPSAKPEGKLTVFLTGATGFLGAFVLHKLLSLKDTSHADSFKVKKVICLVRASNLEKGIQRLRDGLSDKGLWDENWLAEKRVEVILGDLAGGDRLGATEEEWKRMEQEVDVILHNGALVHWVYPYEKLRAANVISTLALVKLASTPNKPKQYVFVSSTSAVDTEHYVHLSDELLASRLAAADAAPESGSGADISRGVPEADDLEGSRHDLKTGYGQSKWVSEKLLFEAGRRGLRGHIVRPGYVVGDSTTAVTNTDDFLWRMVKGCVQLGLVPDMNNTVNMVPVDHVALCTALAGVYPLENASGVSTEASSTVSAPTSNLSVLHITAKPLPTFNAMLSSLPKYGFKVETCDYVTWRRKLELHVMEARTSGDPAQEEETNALFPLLHFVLDDLPTSTKAPELDDRNKVALVQQYLDASGVAGSTDSTVDEELLGLYLAWLVKAGFLPGPTVAPATAIEGTEGGVVKALPELADSVVVKASGRSGA